MTYGGLGLALMFLVAVFLFVGLGSILFSFSLKLVTIISVSFVSILSFIFFLFSFLINDSQSEVVTEFLGGSRGDWSSVSDFLGVTLGIPVALLGSVVALVLAHKAYAISKRQEELEQRRYFEDLAVDAANAFWSLSSSIHSLDHSSRGLLRLLMSDEWLYKRSARALDGDRNENEKVDGVEDRNFKEAFGIINQVRIDFENVSDSLLMILRQPLALKCWLAALERVQSEPGRIVLSDSIDQNSALFLAQEIRRYLASHHLKDIPSLISALRVVVAKFRINEGNFVWESSKSMFMEVVEISGSQQTSPFTGKPLVEAFSFTKGHNFFDLADTPISSRTATTMLLSPIQRILLVGSILHLETKQTDDALELSTGQCEGLLDFYSHGAHLLMNLFSFYPTRADLQLGCKKFIDDEFLRKDDHDAFGSGSPDRIYSYLDNLLYRKNVHEYLNPELRLSCDGHSSFSKICTLRVSVDYKYKLSAHNDELSYIKTGYR